MCVEEGNGTLLQYSCLENLMHREAWWAVVHGVARSQTRLSDFIFTFQFHALEKEMATHSSVLAWRMPGVGEPGGLPSMGSHRVGHDWSDLAAAAVAVCVCVCVCVCVPVQLFSHAQLFETSWTVPTRFLCPRDFPGNNTGEAFHFLLQGILSTQGLNIHLCPLHWQADSLPLSHL